MSVVFVFFEKNIFQCQTKSGKKNDMSGIKKVLSKNDDIENKKKGRFLLRKSLFE